MNDPSLGVTGVRHNVSGDDVTDINGYENVNGQ